MSDPPRWLIGQRVAWLGSGSGLPRTATARWIGRLPGMGAGWTVGIELDEALPLGGVDGKWAGHRLFHCKRSHGLFVPLASVIPESDLRTRAKQGLGETLWLKELEDEFREIRDETLKRIKDKEERKKVKNEARKEAETNGAESKKELVTPTDIPKEESVIETQKGKNSVPPVKDEEEQEVYGVYQWYDAIDHTVGECQGPVVEHLYEEVGGKVLGRGELVKHPQTVPRKGRRRGVSRIGTSDGRGGTAMTGVGAGGPTGQVERESGRVGGLSSVEEGEASYGTNSTQRRSGFFSFLRWFKKGKEEHTECNRDCEKEEVEKEEEFDEVLDLPASPRLPSKFGTWSSVDTLASTSSFAFVQPTDYLNRGVNHAELGIEAGPDTDTYRHRLKIRERSRHLDQDLTLRRKYRLHDFEVEPTPEQKRKILLLSSDVIEDEEGEREEIGVSTLGKRLNSTGCKGTVGSQSSSFGRKKRRAPLPPSFDLSLPNTLEHPGKSSGKTDLGSQGSRHRRSASETRTRSGYCHVKGKRKAPPPPKSHSPAFSPTVAQPPPSQAPKIQTVKCTPPTSPRYGSFGRRKRVAPPPPVNVSVREDKEVQAADGLMSGRGEGTPLSPDERRRLIANIAMLRAHAEKGKISMGNTRGMVSPPGSPRVGDGQSQFMRHDYLRIEKGQLLTTTEKVNEGVMGNSASDQKATLSPRPWYKRKSVLRDSPSSSKKDSSNSPTPSFFKSLEKRRPWKRKEGDEVGGLGDDEDDDDWMPEVGYRRPGGIFGATANAEAIAKKEDEEVSGDDQTEQIKRRSQVISMLANISELDREAAAIVSEERKKEREAASAEDEKFYAEPELPPMLAAAWSGGVATAAASTVTTSNNEENNLFQSKSNAKHLISLFNSISGVTNINTNNETRVTSYISVVKDVTIEEQDSEEEAERKRSTAETVQALVLDANRARLNGRKNLMRNGGSSSGSEKSQGVVGNLGDSESKNSESKLDEASGPEKEDPPQVWVCSRCTLENPKWRLTCDACNMWRPSGGWQGRKGSGDSEVKNKVENLEKENPSKINSKSDGANINWELELKKYFPKQDEKKGESKTVATSKSSESKEGDLQEKTVASAVGGFKEDKSQENVVASTSNVPAVKKEFVVPNFIGGVGAKQTKEAPKEKCLAEKTENGTEKDSKDIKADLYEVRKARLAFFSIERGEVHDKPPVNEGEVEESLSAQKFSGKIEGKEETSEKNAALKKFLANDEKANEDGNLENKKRVNVKPASVSVDTLSKSKQNSEEKQKLRDMLKEMKNSLPHAHRSKGAIKKVPTETRAIVEEIPPPPPQRADSTAEAYLVTTETVYENIKIRPQPLPPGTKVSSSAQTSSAIVRRITPSNAVISNSASVDKVPYPSPPSAPSLSTINKGEMLIKDGILYTSLKRKVIGAGTFELIRAGDFASIEATKTGANGSPVHLYANLPPPGRVRASGAVRLVQRSSEGIPPAGPFPSHRQEFSGKIGDQPRAMAVKAETPFPPALPSQPDKDYSKEGDEARAEEDRLTAQLTLPKGLAKFKASLVPEDEGNLTDLEASGRLNPDTLAVARLLRRLEAAIAGGQHESAAVLARQLARLKINCSVTRHANNRRSLMGSPRESSVEGGPSSAASSTSGSTKITIDMYVEDKVSHLGPIPVVVSTSMTVGELKTRVEQDFEIPVNVQRWIIGRRLASNDSLTLLQHDVTSNGTPVFLYLVAPGDSEASASGNASAKDSKSSKGSEKGEEPDMSEFKKAEEESAPAAPEERMIAKPVDEMPRGRGWYYNFEEDRYSYCSDSDSDAEEVEQPRTIAEAERTEVVPERETVKTAEPRRSVIIQNGVRLIMQEDEYDDEEEFIDGEEVEEEEYVEEVIEEVEEEEEEIEEEEVEEEEVEEEEVEEEEVEEEDEEEDVAGAIGGAHHVAISPREHQTTPSINKPDLPPEDKTNTLKLGWKCPLCTLVNPPTRPGCAACASERPATYRLPSNYKAGRAEAERLDKEEKSQMAQQEAKKNEEDEKKRDYERLLHLEKSELVPNAEEFTCPVCFVDSAPNEGVTLRDCLHTFCRLCLVNTIQFSEEAEVKCPYRDDDYACDSTLQDREIRALVPADVYEQLLARSMALAEKKMGAQAFHCKTPDCKGWCVLEDNINVFPCPVCRRTNCLTCQAIHDGLNCKQYQEGLNKESETNADAKRTKDMLEEMVTRGEAIVCPTCAVVLMKKWGCDWLRCSMCKTEICWVTRGPRWGPGGKGDISGGCKCGVNGIKCHPKCNYCH